MEWLKIISSSSSSHYHQEREGERKKDEKARNILVSLLVDWYTMNRCHTYLSQCAQKNSMKNLAGVNVCYAYAQMIMLVGLSHAPGILFCTFLVRNYPQVLKKSRRVFSAIRCSDVKRNFIKACVLFSSRREILAHCTLPPHNVVHRKKYVRGSNFCMIQQPVRWASEVFRFLSTSLIALLDAHLKRETKRIRIHT